MESFSACGLDAYINAYSLLTISLLLILDFDGRLAGHYQNRTDVRSYIQPDMVIYYAEEKGKI